MEPSTINIKRTSRVGFGWTALVDRSGNLHEIEKPDYVGTVKTVVEKLYKDKNYLSLNGTYHRDQWFVRINGEWHKIKFEGTPMSLYWAEDDGEYLMDRIEATLVN